MVCSGNTYVISQLRNCSEEEREEKLSSFVNHLHKAKNQRAFYHDYCKNKDASTQVISFDFAQTVHRPVSPQQPGSAYFKAKIKCSVFGITDEKRKVQVLQFCYQNFQKFCEANYLQFLVIFSFITWPMKSLILGKVQIQSSVIFIIT